MTGEAQGGNNICFSGGAEGADSLFGHCADGWGHRVVNYSFPSHKTSCPFRFILNETQLVLADKDLTEVAKQLDRSSFANYNTYTKNLLRRNWWIIKDVTTVYAIARFKYNMEQVNGGTGWGVQLALNFGKTLFVYDQTFKSWWTTKDIGPKYKDHKIHWDKLLGPAPTYELAQPPFPKNLYAGIGNRELTEDGKQAIIKLFEKST